MSKCIAMLVLAVWLLSGCPAWAEGFTALSEEADFQESSGEELFEEDDFGFENESDELSFAEDDVTMFDQDQPPEPEYESRIGNLLSASRFTIKHETSYKTHDPQEIVNNRDSLRWEFSKFFANYFFLQVDTKLNLFWGNDHRAEAEDKDALLETNTKEAFLQVSFDNTSIKAGIQIMIWGESDGGVITDVISPRDLSELFFISLEESRIGQPMLILDQYTAWGDWTLFYIPDPEFNETPKKGTAYYYDAFAGLADFQDETTDEAVAEYGLRWKKTFGKSDLAFMAASLIQNDYVYQRDGTSSKGNMLITKTRQRFTMVGITFNFVSGNFLYKGELGRKTPQSFNNASYQIVKRDVSDVALGLEYSIAGSYTLGLEVVNSHIHDWNKQLAGTTENTRSLVWTWSNTFFNEDLSVNWTSTYIEPRIGRFHSLRGSYKWDDRITLELEAYYPDIPDEENSYWIYRNEKRITGRVQIQF